jgi:conjugative relaxase-like TrwC/TraI family protein
MLRMIQSQSAEQAKEYRQEELSQSGYYLDQQELKGAFHGLLVQRLGLTSVVDKKSFDALCDNLNPATFKKLTPRTVSKRTVGYDINFHCPKSVSVLHVLSHDDHILEAFRRSVMVTMQDIEADMMTRVRKGGRNEDRPTGEMLWADFIHQTARPTIEAEPDPHLHCHCYTFNVTYDSIEQRYKAGMFRDIKRDMPYYEARFHKRLADALTGLGYRIRRTGKYFEVEGVPQNVINLFSKRTNEIGRIAKEEGITNARELGQLGARTRIKKNKNLSMAELKQDWRRQIYEVGMTGGDTGGALIRHAPVNQPHDRSAADCVTHALQHSFERSSVVHDRRVLASAYRHAVGCSGVTLESITRAFRQDSRIISVQDGQKLLCTTHEVLAEERRMVELAQSGKGKLIPLYDIPLVKGTLMSPVGGCYSNISQNSGMTFRNLPPLNITGDQADAVIHALTTTDRVTIIRGGAGTGKTTTMKELVGLIEQAGIMITMVAPTANASRGVLREEGFDRADTVAKLLADEEMQKGLSGGCLIVDEAGLLGVRDLSALLQLVTDRNARLILVGDTRQHNSVIRGDALRILNTIAGIQAAEINKIYRQRHEVYRKAVEELAVGNVRAAFERLYAFGAIKEIDKGDPHKQLVTDYMGVIRRRKTVLVVSPTHKQVDAVTASIRTVLREEGRIGAEEITVTRYVSLNLTEAEKADPRHYQSGQVVQFSQRMPGIKHGSLLRVWSLSNSQVILAGEDGKALFLPLDRAGGFAVYRETSMQLAIGDNVIITRNSMDQQGKRLNNGHTLKVMSIDDGGAIRFINEASRVTYILNKEFGHIAYGYATTSNSAQGRTVDEVLIAQPAETFPATSMQQFYVSVSRARDMVHIYTDDKEALLENASETGDRQSALELTGIAPIAFTIARNNADPPILQQIPTPVPIPAKPSPIGIHAPKPAKLTL